MFYIINCIWASKLIEKLSHSTRVGIVRLFVRGRVFEGRTLFRRNFFFSASL